MRVIYTLYIGGFNVDDFFVFFSVVMIHIARVILNFSVDISVGKPFVHFSVLYEFLTPKKKARKSQNWQK